MLTSCMCRYMFITTMEHTPTVPVWTGKHEYVLWLIGMTLDLITGACMFEYGYQRTGRYNNIDTTLSEPLEAFFVSLPSVYFVWFGKLHLGEHTYYSYLSKLCMPSYTYVVGSHQVHWPVAMMICMCCRWFIPRCPKHWSCLIRCLGICHSHCHQGVR